MGPSHRKGNEVQRSGPFHKVTHPVGTEPGLSNQTNQPKLYVPLKEAESLKHSEDTIVLETKALLSPSWMLMNFIYVFAQAQIKSTSMTLDLA